MAEDKANEQTNSARTDSLRQALLQDELKRVRDLAEDYVAEARRFPITIGTLAVTAVASVVTVLQTEPSYLLLVMVALMGIVLLLAYFYSERCTIGTWADHRAAELEQRLLGKGSIYTLNVRLNAETVASWGFFVHLYWVGVFPIPVGADSYFGGTWTRMARTSAVLLGLVEGGVSLGALMVAKLYPLPLWSLIGLFLLFSLVAIIAFRSLYTTSVKRLPAQFRSAGRIEITAPDFVFQFKT